jgi:hydroxyacylglutathione hydrolase
VNSNVLGGADAQTQAQAQAQAQTQTQTHRSSRAFRNALCALLMASCAAWAACASTGVLVVLPGLAPFETPEGITGLPTVDGYRYLVPVDGGLVMIDAGFERPTRIELDEYVKGRRVLAIFVTHGHADHTLGIDAYEGIPIYVSARELPLVRGEAMWRAPLQQLFRAALGASRADNARVVDDGEIVVVGGRTFRAIALPGHTAGSTAWLMGDTLFSGDALMCNEHDELGFPPTPFSDDERRMEASLARLREQPFRILLDGHHGRCVGAWQRVPAFVRAQRQDREARENAPYP